MSEISGSATSGCSGAESDDRRLDGCHESRRGREVKLRIVEDGFDRVAKGLLVVGCATEWIEDLCRYPGDELLADSTDRRRRDRAVVGHDRNGLAGSSSSSG